jgi:23S rRNA (pseudouridine1915-N3)-methyltransferase
MLAGHAKVDLVEVRGDEQVAARVPDRAFRVLLASDGELFDSEAFAGWLDQRRLDARDVCFVIGGPKGLDLQADMRLSLGPMTLPHQLARVVLLEQIFRAHKILAREPYHY